MFILEFVLVGGCHFWGFDTCNAGYIEHDYATIADILGIE